MVDFNLLPPCTIFTQRKVHSLLSFQDSKTVIHCIRLHSNPSNVLQRVCVILCKIWEAIKSFFGCSYHQRSLDILKIHLCEKFSRDLLLVAPEKAALLAKQWITRLIDLNDLEKEYSKEQLDILLNQALIQKEHSEKEFNTLMNLFPKDEIEQVKLESSPKKKFRTPVKNKENYLDKQLNFKEVESEGSDEDDKRKSQKEEEELFNKSFNHIMNLDEKNNKENGNTDE